MHVNTLIVGNIQDNWSPQLNKIYDTILVLFRHFKVEKIDGPLKCIQLPWYDPCDCLCVEWGSTMSLNMPPNNLPLRELLAEKLWAVDQATDGVIHTYAHTQTAWRTHTAGTIWLPLKLTPTPSNHKQADSMSLCAKLCISTTHNNVTWLVFNEILVIGYDF